MADLETPKPNSERNPASQRAQKIDAARPVTYPEDYPPDPPKRDPQVTHIGVTIEGDLFFGGTPAHHDHD